MESANRVLGIDFGTSTTLLAEGIRGQKATLQPIGRTTNEMPSTVGRVDGRIVVGEDAENLPLAMSRRSIKRAITEGWDEIWLGHDPENPLNADVAIIQVLQELGTRAMSLGLPLEDENVRLSCPASWTGGHRNRLLDLARNAGLPVDDHTLIDEPVAAGIAWIVHQTEDLGVAVHGKILIFDMGGGTVDIAHLHVRAEPGRDPRITVLSSVGMAEAGDRLDEDLAHELLDHYTLFQGLPEPPDDIGLVAAARSAAAEVKQELSSQPAAFIELSAPGWNTQQMALTRERLEEIFEAQWRRAAAKIWECLRASTLTYVNHEGAISARKLEESTLARDVDHIVLVGGMSQIPLIARRIAEMFPSSTIHRHYGVKPTEAVVAGLSETSVYDDISFHRPAYDFVLSFAHDSAENPEMTLYPAYAPLYSFADAINADDPYYEFTIARNLPRTGTGKIVIRSPQGSPVGINLDSRLLDGIPVSFGSRGIRLRLKPNGEVLVVDGKDSRWRARVTGWPAIRGARNLEIIMSRDNPANLPEIRLGHQHNNRYG